MPIRLGSAQSRRRNLRDWCLRCLPPLSLAWYLSDGPTDWLFFLVGYIALRTATHAKGTRGDSGGERAAGPAGLGSAAPARPPPRSVAAASLASLSPSPSLPLATLPSVVLWNVGCYLHPRDVLGLDAALRSARNPRLGGSVDASLHDVWKRLWYRDYGEVLLRWEVSRAAFRRSLLEISSQSNGDVEVDPIADRVGEKLADRLDEMAKMPNSMTMKEFYFVFGECYIDYVLARRNTMDGCFLGMHGHIFDFTDFADYHPGLIEPILKECGRDATHFFEELPHSFGARKIAQRLCVVVNHNVIDYGPDSDYSPYGLELVLADDSSSENKRRALRSSNSRPLPQASSKKYHNKGMGQGCNRWMPHVVPCRRWIRRHPTLERIRTRFQHDQQQQQPIVRGFIYHWFRNQQSATQNVPEQRVYYDPLQQKWIRWAVDGSE